MIRLTGKRGFLTRERAAILALHRTESVPVPSRELARKRKTLSIEGAVPVGLKHVAAWYGIERQV